MPTKITLDPPPSQIEEFDNIWKSWLVRLHDRLGDGPLMIRGYTVATAPDPTEWSDATNYSAMIFVSDETGGATLAFTDGTNWRRVQDRTIIS